MPFLRLNKPPPTYAVKPSSSEDALKHTTDGADTIETDKTHDTDGKLLPSYAKDWALNALFRRLSAALDGSKAISGLQETERRKALESVSSTWKELSILLPQCAPVSVISCLRRNKFFAQAQSSLKRICQLCSQPTVSNDSLLCIEFLAIGDILQELRSEQFSHSDAGAFIRIDPTQAADLLNSTTIFIGAVFSGRITPGDPHAVERVFEVFLDIWRTSVYGTVDRAKASQIFSQACLGTFITLASELNTPERTKFTSLLNEQVATYIISLMVLNGTSTQSRKQLRDVLKAFTKNKKDLDSKLHLFFALAIDFVQTDAVKSTATRREIASMIFAELVFISLGIDLESGSKPYTPTEESNKLLQGLLSVCVEKRLTLSKEILASAATIFSGLSNGKIVFWQTIRNLLQLEPVIFIENDDLKTRLTTAITMSGETSERAIVLDSLLYFLSQFAHFKSMPDFLDLWGTELERLASQKSQSGSDSLWLDERLLPKVSEFIEKTMIASQISQQIRKRLTTETLALSSVVILPCLLQSLARKNHSLDLADIFKTILPKLGNQKVQLWLKRRLVLSLLEILPPPQISAALHLVSEDDFIALVDSSSSKSTALDKAAAVQIELKMIEIDRLYDIDSPKSIFSSFVDFRRTKALSSSLSSEGTESSLRVLLQILPRWLAVLNLDTSASSNFLTALGNIAKSASPETQKKAVALWRWVSRPEALDRLPTIRDAICDIVEALFITSIDKAKDLESQKASFVFAANVLVYIPLETLNAPARTKLLSKLLLALGKVEVRQQLSRLDKQHVLIALMHFAERLATAKLIAGKGKDFIKLLDIFMGELPTQTTRLFGSTIKNLLQHRDEEDVHSLLQKIVEATFKDAETTDASKLLLQSACIEEFWTVRDAFESLALSSKRERLLKSIARCEAEGKEAELLLRSVDKLLLLDTASAELLSGAIALFENGKNSKWSSSLQARLLWHNKASLDNSDTRKKLLALLLAPSEKSAKPSASAKDLLSKLSAEDFVEALQVFSSETGQGMETSAEKQIFGEILSAAALASRAEDGDVVSNAFSEIFNSACAKLEAGFSEYDLSLVELFIYRGSSLVTYSVVDTFFTTAIALLSQPDLTLSTLIRISKLTHSLLLSHHPLNCGRSSSILTLATSILSLLIRKPTFTALLKNPETSLTLVKLFQAIIEPVERGTTTKQLLAQGGVVQRKVRKVHRTDAEVRYRHFLLEAYVKVQMAELGAGGASREVGEVLFAGMKHEDYVKAMRIVGENGRSVLSRMDKKRGM